MASLFADGERVTHEGNTCDIIGSDSIALCINDQTGEDLLFKMKRTDTFEKVFLAYAKRRGIEYPFLRFTFDGTRMNKEHTPEKLNMEDNDQIDVMLETSGGGQEDGVALVPASEESITVKVRDQDGGDVAYIVTKRTPMSKIFNAIAQKKCVPVEFLKFLFDGKHIAATDTPKMLEMEDEDQIEVFNQQEGGVQEEGEAVAVKGQQDGDDVTHFKIKKGTKLQKLMPMLKGREILS